MPFIPLFQSPKSFYRLAVASFFFLQGLVFASWASRIPDIKQALDLNEAQLGGVLFAIPRGADVGDGPVRLSGQPLRKP